MGKRGMIEKSVKGYYLGDVDSRMIRVVPWLDDVVLQGEPMYQANVTENVSIASPNAGDTLQKAFPLARNLTHSWRTEHLFSKT
jgi:hypothetical protein